MTMIAPASNLACVEVALTAICETCRTYHPYRVTPDRIPWAMDEWQAKHRVENGCETQFVTSKRTIHAKTPGAKKIDAKKFDDRAYEAIGRAPWWLEYRHNTDFKLSYRASAAVTNAIEGLATSSTWLAGYESAVIDNTTNLDIDICLSGLVTVGTTPTINTTVELHSVSMNADATWPDVFDGTTSAETVTSQGVKDGICIPVAVLNVDATTSDRAYPFTKRSLAALYGGFCPPKSVVFTTHNTGVNLNATGGNQVLTQAGIFMTGA